LEFARSGRITDFADARRSRRKLANDRRRDRLAPRDFGQLGLQLAHEGFGAGNVFGG
jgi:hypothetical protein